MKFTNDCSCQWGEIMSELQPPTVLLLIPHILYEYGALVE